MSDSETREWLETDGAGGYAMGTESLICTRKYHGLLIAARNPPVDRLMLISRVDVTLVVDSQRYSVRSVELVSSDIGVAWILTFNNDLTMRQELLMCPEPRMSTLQYTILSKHANITLEVRPWMTCRDHHALHFRNPHFDFTHEESDELVCWSPYPGIPNVRAIHSGAYVSDPSWMEGVRYPEERDRGYEFIEDLASPGYFRFDMDTPPLLAFSAEAFTQTIPIPKVDRVRALIRSEQKRRRHLGSALDRAGDQFIVGRNRGKSIIAGYPWFNDWGRDTMIALRGLTIARNRSRTSYEILMTWAEAISDGMLPNRFPNRGDAQHNSVDAPLWFVVAAYDYLNLPEISRGRLELVNAIGDVLHHFGERGTRFGIRMESDGLLTAGDEHTQLTWMDANIDGVPVTPRHGKPVGIQAQWINALWIGAQFEPKWETYLYIALESFTNRFWMDAGYLADRVHGESVDSLLRPNQIFAVGGLPCAVVSKDKAKQVVDTVERNLWTPRGLRTLSPDAPQYRGHYSGSHSNRDGAYHQGTAWPWLLGPFVEAWLRVRDYSEGAKVEAKSRFIRPWEAQLSEAGIGHVSEIADGDAPHSARGCPFQAWSISELIRVKALLETPPPVDTIWIAERARVSSNG